MPKITGSFDVGVFVSEVSRAAPSGVNSLRYCYRKVSGDTGQKPCLFGSGTVKQITRWCVELACTPQEMGEILGESFCKLIPIYSEKRIN